MVAVVEKSCDVHGQKLRVFCSFSCSVRGPLSKGFRIQIIKKSLQVAADFNES